MFVILVRLNLTFFKINEFGSVTFSMDTKWSVTANGKLCSMKNIAKRISASFTCFSVWLTRLASSKTFNFGVWFEFVFLGNVYLAWERNLSTCIVAAISFIKVSCGGGGSSGMI